MLSEVTQARPGIANRARNLGEADEVKVVAHLVPPRRLALGVFEKGRGAFRQQIALTHSIEVLFPDAMLWPRWNGDMAETSVICFARRVHATALAMGMETCPCSPWARSAATIENAKAFSVSMMDPRIVALVVIPTETPSRSRVASTYRPMIRQVSESAGSNFCAASFFALDTFRSKNAFASLADAKSSFVIRRGIGWKTAVAFNIRLGFSHRSFRSLIRFTYAHCRLTAATKFRPRKSESPERWFIQQSQGFRNGGRDRDRTCDPYDVNVVLSR